MEISRFQNIETFAEQVEPFLCDHEAEHNLMLGIITQIRRAAIDPEGDLYLATVEENGQIVAAALRTPPHNVAISRGPDEAITLLARDVSDAGHVPPGVVGPKHESRQFAEAWQQVSGQSFHLDVAQRIYQLDQVVPVTGVPGRMRPASGDDLDWLVPWSNAFVVESREETWTMERSRRLIEGYLAFDTRGIYVWEVDGTPVSIAGYAGPTPNGIRVSHVYTPPDLRGRGYASAVTAALSQQLLDSGNRYCFLYTDLSNPTSNRIYQRIGYQPVADVDEWLFDTPDTA